MTDRTTTVPPLPVHRVRVESGKYTFRTIPEDTAIAIDRYGEPWHRQSEGFNAIRALMTELDAARVVVAALRSHESFLFYGGGALRGIAETRNDLVEAIERHRRLVSDAEPPSEWAMGHSPAHPPEAPPDWMPQPIQNPSGSISCGRCHAVGNGNLNCWACIASGSMTPQSKIQLLAALHARNDALTKEFVALQELNKALAQEAKSESEGALPSDDHVLSDADRIDAGDFIRASGDAGCSTCVFWLRQHPDVPGYATFVRRCDGVLVKL